MTSQPPLQLLHSTTRGRSLPRTVADARAASPTDDQVNASEDATPDQLVETCLFPSQLLTVEMLRRPLEFALAAVVGMHHRLTRRWTSTPDGHLHGVDDELGPDVIGDRPPHDSA